MSDSGFSGWSGYSGFSGFSGFVGTSNREYLNLDYSLEETCTGIKWFDNRQIFRKVFFIESMPIEGSGDTNTIKIPHGIINFDTLIYCDGTMRRKVGNPLIYPINSSYSPGVGFSPRHIWVDKTNINIPSNSYDWSNYSAYLILEYIKECCI